MVKCEICGKELKDKSGLAGHKMLAHGIKENVIKYDDLSEKYNQLSEKYNFLIQQFENILKKVEQYGEEYKKKMDLMVQNIMKEKDKGIVLKGEEEKKDEENEKKRKDNAFWFFMFLLISVLYGYGKYKETKKIVGV